MPPKRTRVVSQNAGCFVAAQSISRFVHAFLTTAVRYETLDRVGGRSYAFSQMWQNVTRTITSQVAGVVTDNAPLKATYVLLDVIAAATIAALWIGTTEIAHFLTAANLALGVVMAFSGPVGKSLPPSVVDTPSELPMVNSFELTGDKIGRYTAPFAVSFFLLYFDFSSLIHLSILLFLVVAVAKSTVRVKDTTPRTPRRKRLGFMTQLIEGIRSLNDPILGMLVFNTMITNLFIYPFQTVALPVILRQMDPVNWKSLTSLVSLGGGLGPVLSNFAAYRFRDDIYKGLISGLIFQIISVILCFCSIAATSALTSSSTFALCMCAIWVVVVAANNHFTVFFNSIQQQILPSGQRGRFIANMLAMFTISNAAGLWLYGQAVSSSAHLHLFVDLILGLCITLRLFISGAMVKRRVALQQALVRADAPMTTKSD